MMLMDPSLHTSFLNHGGLERILEELKLNIKRDDIVCSVRINIFLFILIQISVTCFVEKVVPRSCEIQR